MCLENVNINFSFIWFKVTSGITTYVLDLKVGDATDGLV
jgi:hypothetical protein